MKQMKRDEYGYAPWRSKEGDIDVSLYEENDAPCIHIIVSRAVLIFSLKSWSEVYSMCKFVSEQEKGIMSSWSRKLDGEEKMIEIRHFSMKGEERYLAIELCLNSFHTYLFFKAKRIKKLQRLTKSAIEWLDLNCINAKK